MKKTDTHAFVNQLLMCLLVTICGGGSVGLGMVWMRHRISVLANTNRALAAQIAVVERRLTETSALIEHEQSAELLRQRNTEWRLGLVPVNETQVLPVTGDPVRRLVARSNRELFNDGPPTASFRVALGQ